MNIPIVNNSQQDIFICHKYIPSEILESILINISIQDIFKLKFVDKSFNKLTLKILDIHNKKFLARIIVYSMIIQAQPSCSYKDYDISTPSINLTILSVFSPKKFLTIISFFSLL